MNRFRVLLMVALLIGGCGSDGQGVSELAATDLQARVDQLREVATTGDRVMAESVLLELRQQVIVHHDQGEIDDDAAREILDAAAIVEIELAAIPTTTTTTQPPPAPATGGDDDRGGRGKKGKGRGDD